MHRTSSRKIGAVPAHAAVMERKVVCNFVNVDFGRFVRESVVAIPLHSARHLRLPRSAIRCGRQMRQRSQRKTVFRKVHRCEAIQLKNATGAFGYGWGTPIARTRS
jgi:hypothetical protein